MREPMCLQIADFSEVSDRETDHHAIQLIDTRNCLVSKNTS